MRKINSIVVHCSANSPNSKIKAADIDRMHRERGMVKIGYHYVILPDGTIEKGREEPEEGAHAIGYNKVSIGICYIGGIGAGKVEMDTRTPPQKEALIKLIGELCEKYPITDVLGHRDTYKGTPLKNCPCFDARAEYANLIAAR